MDEPEGGVLSSKSIAKQGLTKPATFCNGLKGSPKKSDLGNCFSSGSNGGSLRNAGVGKLREANCLIMHKTLL